MARIAGVDLPRNKRIEIALTYIYGIGRHAAQVVLNQAGISLDKKSDDLDENLCVACRRDIHRDSISAARALPECCDDDDVASEIDLRDRGSGSAR